MNRWIILGDIHDTFQAVDHIPEITHSKGFIITGDLTFNGGVAEAAQVIEYLTKHAPILHAQIGNMDKPEVTTWLEEKGLNIHGKAVSLHENIVLTGLGGSNATPFNTPSEFSEEEYSTCLEQSHASALPLLGKHTSGYHILVSHTPPHNTLCDTLPNGFHVGSAAVRLYIEKHQPRICLCGHIHEAIGEDRLGNTRIYNPGAFMEGHYAVLEQNPKTGDCTVSLKKLNA